MARNLKKDDDNKVTLLDPVDGTEIVLFHRAVTSRDRVRHMTRKYQRQGNKLINRHHTASIESALDVLTGIREGDFFHGDDPVSSDPESKNFRQDWKELIESMAGDLLFILGADLFEPKADLGALGDIEVVSEFDQEQAPAPAAEVELLPLAKNSGDSKKSARRSAASNA